MCLYSELFWIISPYSVRMWENADQNNSEYGHILRSASYCTITSKITNYSNYTKIQITMSLKY